MQSGGVKPPAEWDAAAKRVLGSELFRQSPKLKDLLAYIAAHSLSGERELLSEQHIRIAVFGRSPGYPGDDSIVRVQARNLREKLAEYFSTEGADNPITITLPKGGYELRFTPRAVAVETPIPAVFPVERPTRQRDIRPWTIVVGCILITSAFLLGYAMHRPASAALESGQRPAGALQGDEFVANPVVRQLFSPPAQTLTILEDATLLMASRVRGRVFSLNEFVSGSTNIGEPSTDPAHRTLEQMLPLGRSISQADLTFAVRLLRLYPHLSTGAVFKHPREIQLREIKSSNCVLFGAQSTDPWIELYDARLNFPRTNPEDEHGFLNRRPLAGEKLTYGNDGGEAATTYARIALLTNFQPGTRVLILTGLGAPETEAAAEFILDPKLTQTLPSELRRRMQKMPGHLEILLSTNRVGRTAGSVHVETWRADDEPIAP